MKMTWSGLIITEHCHVSCVLVNQLLGNFRSKTLCCGKIKSVFRYIKWCFNALWGLKGLSRLITYTSRSNHCRWNEIRVSFERQHLQMFVLKFNTDAFVIFTDLEGWVAVSRNNYQVGENLNNITWQETGYMPNTTIMYFNYFIMLVYCLARPSQQVY